MNRPQAILNCVNKFWTFQELAGHGVPLPDTFSYGKPLESNRIVACRIFALIVSQILEIRRIV